MATTLTSNTFSNTYKDDFADSSSYHRILFNSGKAKSAPIPPPKYIQADKIPLARLYSI